MFKMSIVTQVLVDVLQGFLTLACWILNLRLNLQTNVQPVIGAIDDQPR